MLSKVKFTFDDNTAIVAKFDLNVTPATEVAEQLAQVYQRRVKLLNSPVQKYLKKRSDVLSHRTLRVDFSHNGREVATTLSGVKLKNGFVRDTTAIASALTTMLAEFEQAIQPTDAVLELAPVTEFLAVTV